MENNEKTIIVIEDNATMRNLLKTLLNLEGFSVIDIGDTTLPELLERIEKYNPVAILMDVNLYRLNGLDALKKIRENEKYKNLCIIMSSGEDKELESIRAGASSFLLKPYMPTELINQLHSSINN